MRVHNPDNSTAGATVQDHLLFWPIGQNILAGIIRELLDEFSTQVGKDKLDASQVLAALAPLKRVEWSLHKEPWRHLLLINTPDKNDNRTWIIRNETRKPAVDVALEVLEFIVGVTTLDQESQRQLRQRWTNALIRSQKRPTQMPCGKSCLLRLQRSPNITTTVGMVGWWGTEEDLSR